MSEREQFQPALDSIIRPTKDALKAARTLGIRQARYLVDSYYQIQELRKAAANQAGAMVRAEAHGHAEEPHQTLDWLITQTETMETQLSRMFDFYAQGSAPGRWMQSVHGIGPVLAANFLARLSVHPWKCVNPKVREKRGVGEEMVLPCAPDAPCMPGCAYITVETAGGFWRFAGLDPTMKWNKGEMRPWNAAVKVACWKASDSWVKLKNNPRSYYSRVYIGHKDAQVLKNEQGAFAAAAAAVLAERPKHAQRAIYAQGKLPPGHLDAKARRATVKLFLSHLHEVMYEDEFGRKPPKPFAIEHGGHAHHIPVPGWPLLE